MLQMVQAIQVLRFHLLELEKVSYMPDKIVFIIYVRVFLRISIRIYCNYILTISIICGSHDQLIPENLL